MIEYSRRDDLVEHKVTDGYNLQSCTSAGWVLVASFEETRVERGYGGTTYGPNGVALPPSSPTENIVREVRHIVARPLESALAAAAIVLADAQRTSQNLAELLAEEKDKREQAEARTERAERDVQRWRESNELLTARLDKYRRQEVDLGKLRAAIGAIEFGRIVEGK